MDLNFLETESKPNHSNNKKTGLILVTITGILKKFICSMISFLVQYLILINSFFVVGGAAVLCSVLCFPFILPALRKICLPFVPATSQQLANVLVALKGKSGNLLDIGSGDGRIVSNFFFYKSKNVK